MRLQYDEYEQEETFVVFANADYEYFIIDTTWNEPVYNDWVLDYNFDDGAIRLKISIQGKTQYIVWSGYHNMIIPECMYDFIGEFEYDVAYVMQDNKYNYINNSGELLSKQWFDDCEDWDGEYDIVAINGKKNIFSRYKGEVIMEEWVDNINSSRYDALAEVKLGDKINLVKDNGRLIFPEFVDDIAFDELYNGTDWYIAFCLNGKWNFHGTHYTGILSKVWFDDIKYVEHDRHNTLAWVVIDGEEYTLDLELETLRNDETGEEIDIATDENKNFYNNR